MHACDALAFAFSLRHRATTNSLWRPKEPTDAVHDSNPQLGVEPSVCMTTCDLQSELVTVMGGISKYSLFRNISHSVETFA